MDIGTGGGLVPWVWLAAAVALTLLEARWLEWRLVALPFAITSILAWFLGLAGAGLPVQASVALGAGLLLLVVVQRYRSLVREGSRLPPGVGATRLVGMSATVVDETGPTEGGSVTIGGETWHARSADGTDLAPGATVRVTDVEGTRLLVEPYAVDPAPDVSAPTPTEG